MWTLNNINNYYVIQSIKLNRQHHFKIVGGDGGGAVNNVLHKVEGQENWNIMPIICRLSRIIQESPAYGSDLPLSSMGHRISQIEWTFDLLCALVWNLAHDFYLLYGLWDIFVHIYL